MEREKKKVAGFLFLLMSIVIAILILREGTGRKIVTGEKEREAIDSLSRSNADLKDRASVLETEIKTKEQEVGNLKTKKQAVLVQYKKIKEESRDTDFLYIADSLNKLNDEIIDTLESGLAICKRTIALKDEIISNDSIVIEKYSAIVKEQDEIIQDLRPNWWMRNKFWVGVVSGAAASIVGISAIK